MSSETEGATEQPFMLYFPDCLFEGLPEVYDVDVGDEAWASMTDVTVATRWVTNSRNRWEGHIPGKLSRHTLRRTWKQLHQYLNPSSSRTTRKSLVTIRCVNGS